MVPVARSTALPLPLPAVRLVRLGQHPVPQLKALPQVLVMQRLALETLPVALVGQREVLEELLPGVLAGLALQALLAAQRRLQAPVSSRLLVVLRFRTLAGAFQRQTYRLPSWRHQRVVWVVILLPLALLAPRLALLLHL